MTSASALLDAASASVDVATMTALALIKSNGNANEALALLDTLVDVAPPETDELDVVALSQQAIHIARTLRSLPSGE